MHWHATCTAHAAGLTAIQDLSCASEALNMIKAHIRCSLMQHSSADLLHQLLILMKATLGQAALLKPA